MNFKQMLWLGWRKTKEGETEYYPMNKIIKNPFKNYKSALKYLKMNINSKTLLFNYKPSDIDWALLTIFKSKRFLKSKERI